MNHPARSFLVILLTFGSVVINLCAQAPTAGDPFVKGSAAANANKQASWQNILTVLEIYAVDKADAAALLDTERGGVARYRRVMELSKEGKARLETLTALTTKSGQRALNESFDEVRYPTEFDPPALKTGIPCPTAWETRPTGDILELEIVVGPDGRTCDYNIVPQRTSLAGFEDVSSMVGDALISQPLFHSQRIRTATTARDGEACYLGTITPPTVHGIANGGEQSETWLAFVRAHLVGPKADEIKPAAKEASLSSLSLEYSCYSLDRGQARDLLAAASALNGPWDHLQALMKEKKARLEHITTLNTRSGQRSTVEEVRELRYAIEYEPEGRAASTETTRRTITARPSQAKDAAEATTSEQVTVARTDANAERRPGYPSAFETRNVGVTMEVEPVFLPDGASVDLNHAVQSLIHHGTLQATGVATRYPAQPLFEARKITSSQTLLTGRAMLVGTLNPPAANGVNGRKDEGRTWLLFVRAQNEP